MTDHSHFLSSEQLIWPGTHFILFYFSLSQNYKADILLKKGVLTSPSTPHTIYINQHPLVFLFSKPSNLQPLFEQNTRHEQLKLTFQSRRPFTCNLVLIMTLTWICLQHVYWLNSVLGVFGSPPGGLLPSLSLRCRCVSGLLSLPAALAIARLSIMLLLTNTPLLFVTIINERSIRTCC